MKSCLRSCQDVHKERVNGTVSVGWKDPRKKTVKKGAQTYPEQKI